MMLRHVLLGVAVLLAFARVPAYAAGTIVNLSAASSSPNAGKNSPGYAYNPVTLSLSAGTYTVNIVGIAQGGAYDAMTVYAPGAGNAAYQNKDWSISLNGGTSAAFTQAPIGGTTADYDGAFKQGRYNTAASSLAAYSSAGGTTFSLATSQSVSFYVDDSSFPSFGDDSGGISLLVSNIPEPATIGLLGLGVFGIVLTMRQRSGGRT